MDKHLQQKSRFIKDPEVCTLWCKTYLFMRFINKCSLAKETVYRFKAHPDFVKRALPTLGGEKFNVMRGFALSQRTCTLVEGLTAKTFYGANPVVGSDMSWERVESYRFHTDQWMTFWRLRGGRVRSALRLPTSSLCCSRKIIGPRHVVQKLIYFRL